VPVDNKKHLEQQLEDVSLRDFQQLHSSAHETTNDVQVSINEVT